MIKDKGSFLTYVILELGTDASIIQARDSHMFKLSESPTNIIFFPFHFPRKLTPLNLNIKKTRKKKQSFSVKRVSDKVLIVERKQRLKLKGKKSGLFDQSKYIQDYQKQTYKRYIFQVRKDNADLISWLESKPNKQRYILDLIEKDMNQNK